LDLGSCWEVEDLTALASFTALWYLNLSDCKKVKDLTALASSINLEQLFLKGTDKVIDISLLEGMATLKISLKVFRNLFLLKRMGLSWRRKIPALMRMRMGAGMKMRMSPEIYYVKSRYDV
jgi:hypothetical protein